MESIRKRSRAPSFQSHLYGIESGYTFNGAIRHDSFNRTFMELKVDVSVEARNENNGFNRTFMELKENHLAKWNNAQIVSIAPLWNWKGSSSEIGSICPRFNRTFMELKEVNGIVHGQRHQVSIAPLWNWKIKGHFMHICCASQEGSAIQML